MYRLEDMKKDLNTLNNLSLDFHTRRLELRQLIFEAPANSISTFVLLDLHTSNETTLRRLSDQIRAIHIQMSKLERKNKIWKKLLGK